MYLKNQCNNVAKTFYNISDLAHMLKILYILFSKNMFSIYSTISNSYLKAYYLIFKKITARSQSIGQSKILKITMRKRENFNENN